MKNRWGSNKAIRISSKRAAEMWCDLNCYKVPKELKGLKEKDFWGAMEVLKTMTTAKTLEKTWIGFVPRKSK